jgi:hypothetical protein
MGEERKTKGKGRTKKKNQEEQKKGEKVRRMRG